MSKEMVISSNPHETRVAIMEEGQLCEYYVERQKEFALVGSIYKGRVTRVLPGMQSAFVEIGLDSDAFLYVSDFLEGIEEFDSFATTVVDKVHKMEDQGGQVFAAENSVSPIPEPPEVIGAAEPLAREGNVAPKERVGLPPAAFAPSPKSTAPAAAPPHHDRQHSDRAENSGRQGRDFGRGRRGRFNNKRGRGAQGRFGRELPSSKYAPSRPLETSSSETEPVGNDFAPIILPGESLAKYREKASAPPAGESAGVEIPPSAAAAPPETLEATLAVERAALATSSVENLPEESAVAEKSDHIEAAPNETRAENQNETYPEAPAPSHSPSSYLGSLGLEPLPGESLAKYKNRDTAQLTEPHSAALTTPPLMTPVLPQGVREELSSERSSAIQPPAPVASGPAPPAEKHLPHHSQVEDEEENQDDDDAQIREALAISEDRVPEELSEDEAAALAQQVAEAQIEAEARAAMRRESVAEESAALGEEPEVQVEIGSDINEAESEDEDTESHEESESGTELEETLHFLNEGELAGVQPNSDPGPEASLSEEGVAPVGESQPQSPQQPWKAHVRDDFRARMQNPNRRGRDRGRRNDRGRRHSGPGHQGPSQSHGQRPQPRRPQLIADMLKQGQEIIVQIAKEPLGKKGARITSHVALPGRYLVYMPTLDHTGVSRKIASAEERARLRHLVNDAKGTAGGGFIVRTAAASAPPEDVRTDVEFLTRTWSEIKTRSEQRKAPSLLHRDLNLVERILRDYITPDFNSIWVDSEEEFTKVVDFMSRFQPQLVNRVKLYTRDTPVFEEFGIQQEIDKGLRPKVWLKSGGYIVINHTEALVAIDVNTGKFVGKGSNRLEDTIVRTNLEAVKEIVRQMRLRDLGGIIVIDFIDMEDRRNREKVMAALEDALRADRAPSKMLRFNEFGLIAITRKRTKQALERTLCQPCPYCTGSGMVKSIPTLCYEIQTEARKMAPDMTSGSITLRVHPEISKALKTRESSLIEELEHWTKKSVIIQADPTLHWEQYDIY